MLTHRGKYGLKALVQLALLDGGQTMQAIEIARANAIPKRFLDAILTDLRKAGLVRTQKGPGGGYALACPPHEIKVGAIVRALDGPLTPIACASRTAFKSCDDCLNPEFCSVRLIMCDVRDAMVHVLDNMTLARMAERPRTAA